MDTFIAVAFAIVDTFVEALATLDTDLVIAFVKDIATVELDTLVATYLQAPTFADSPLGTAASETLAISNPYFASDS